MLVVVLEVPLPFLLWIDFCFVPHSQIELPQSCFMYQMKTFSKATNRLIPATLFQLQFVGIFFRCSAPRSSPIAPPRVDIYIPSRMYTLLTLYYYSICSYPSHSSFRCSSTELPTKLADTIHNSLVLSSCEDMCLRNASIPLALIENTSDFLINQTSTRLW